MRKFSMIVTFVLIFVSSLNAQDMKKNNLPYYQIPDYPEEYTAGTVVSRMIDGLGFRYYWATEGLRQKDLDYRSIEGSRTSAETIDHIYNLSFVIVNAVSQKINKNARINLDLTFSEKRKVTLENLHKASNVLKVSKELKDFKLVFKGKNNTNEYPFWNNINGPISDAIWHAGQIVLMRRASGNPVNSKANVFIGKFLE
jgi:hypothetical protein